MISLLLSGYLTNSIPTKDLDKFETKKSDFVCASKPMSLLIMNMTIMMVVGIDGV